MWFVVACTASKDLPTPSHRVLYAFIECWLRFLLNISENIPRFSGRIFHAYGSFGPGLRRTSDGFTVMPSVLSWIMSATHVWLWVVSVNQRMWAESRSRHKILHWSRATLLWRIFLQSWEVHNGNLYILTKYLALLSWACGYAKSTQHL